MSTPITAAKFIALDNFSHNGSRRLTEYPTPTCADCAHFRPYHLKQANGSYRPVGCLGACSKSDHKLDAFLSMVPAESHRCDCKNFEPINPDSFKQVWVKTPAN